MLENIWHAKQIHLTPFYGNEIITKITSFSEWRLEVKQTTQANPGRFKRVSDFLPS